jgi:hypothetical protein
MIIPTGEGYADALKDNTWYKIDLWEKKVKGESARGNPLRDRNFILANIINPEEWGSWVNEIPVTWVD